jgi:hypothetical protein
VPTIFAAHVTVGTRSLSSGAHSRDPVALPTLQDYTAVILVLAIFGEPRRMAASTAQNTILRDGRYAASSG